MLSSVRDNSLRRRHCCSHESEQEKGERSPGKTDGGIREKKKQKQTKQVKREKSPLAAAATILKNTQKNELKMLLCACTLA